MRRPPCRDRSALPCSSFRRLGKPEPGGWKKAERPCARSSGEIGPDAEQEPAKCQSSAKSDHSGLTAWSPAQREQGSPGQRSERPSAYVSWQNPGSVLPASRPRRPGPSAPAMGIAAAYYAIALISLRLPLPTAFTIGVTSTGVERAWETRQAVATVRAARSSLPTKGASVCIRGVRLDRDEAHSAVVSMSHVPRAGHGPGSGSGCLAARPLRPT